MDLSERDASPEYVLQCLKWCIENSDIKTLEEHLKLHASNLHTYTEEFIQLMLDAVAKNLSSSLHMFISYVDDTLLNQELFKGGKSVINKMMSQAVVNRDIAIVDSLLQRGADANLQFHGKPLLHIAACNGDFDIVESLIKHGADINSLDRRGDNVLYAAITSQLDTKAAMVTYLIKEGVKIHSTSVSGKYPLHIAAAHSGDVVETLITEGQHVDVTDDVNKDTPLHIACGLCCQETIMRLIQHGAKFNMLNKYGETPLTKLLKFVTDFHDFHSRTRINIARKLIAVGFKMKLSNESGSKSAKGRDKTRDKYLTLKHSMEEVPSLQTLSRAIIVNTLPPKSSPVKVLTFLDIPQHLKTFLMFRDGALKF